MRAYWTVQGFEEPTFTALPAKAIVDTETDQWYATSNMVFLKRSEAPKNLIEENHKYSYIPLQNEYHIEKKGLFRKIKVTTKIYPTSEFQTKDPCRLLGLWVVEGCDPIVYTDQYCAFIRERETGKLYKLGERVIFRKEEEYPDFYSLAEYSGKFDFISNNITNQNTYNETMTPTDYLREIWVQNLFK